VIAVEMPPLRSRHEDLIRFAEHYLRHFAAQCGRRLEGFAADTSECLRTYGWPGNLRELRNAIERAVIMARNDRIVPEDLPGELRSPGSAPVSSNGESTPGVGGRITLEQLEEAHLRKVLAQTPSLVEAAQVLGIDQATLYRKRKKLGLD
jgi:NtrC-family two-component system response regulator AlgB